MKSYAYLQNHQGVNKRTTLREECALAATYSFLGKSNAFVSVKKLLQNQINRGNLSSGIAFLDKEKRLKIIKKCGVVDNIFGKELEPFLTPVCIGHNRYATSGTNLTKEEIFNNAQPYLVSNRQQELCAFCFNGHIANFENLRREYNLISDKLRTDTEVFRLLIQEKLSTFTENPSDKDYLDLFKFLSSKIEGAYSLILLDVFGNLVAVRDPLGFRPLCYGEKEDGLFIASESAALETAESKKVKFLENGEMLIVRANKSIKKYKFAKTQAKKLCIFEFIYFMKPGSSFDGKSVANSRKAMGKLLAKKEKLPLERVKKSIISYVPSSSRLIFKSYIDYFKNFIPLNRVKILVKCGLDRAFISDFSQKDRSQILKEKLKLTKETKRKIEGKELILIDDSIVRGDTLKYLVPILKKGLKPKKIHVRVGAAPIKFPCFYGINIPTKEELIANNRNVRQIKSLLNLDSLSYNSLKDIILACTSNSLTAKNFCTACFSGRYPTKINEKMTEKSRCL